jgi:hypothetical protein
MDLFTGIAIGAVLFALYGLVRNYGCTGSCNGCSNSCDRHERHAHND